MSRSSSAMSTFILAIFQCANLDEADDFDEVVNVKWLREHRALHALDEFVHLWTSAQTGDENKARTQVRADSFNGKVKHVARQRRHHHVADDHLEIARHHFTHAFDSIADGHYFVEVRFKEALDDLAKLFVVLEQQNLFCLQSGVLVGKIDSFGGGLHGRLNRSQDASCHR